MKDFEQTKCEDCGCKTYHICLLGTPSTPAHVKGLKKECTNCKKEYVYDVKYPGYKEHDAFLEKVNDYE